MARFEGLWAVTDSICGIYTTAPNPRVSDPNLQMRETNLHLEAAESVENYSKLFFFFTEQYRCSSQETANGTQTLSKGKKYVKSSVIKFCII